MIMGSGFRAIAASLRLGKAEACYSYCVAIRFSGASAVNARLEIFEKIKKLGSFRIRDQAGGGYSLEFRTELAREGLEERLGEISGRPGLFEFSVGDAQFP